MWKSKWAKDRDKRNLWTAIFTNDIEKVDEYIKAGANPNSWLSPYTVDENSLHVAVRCGHTQIVQLLLKAGANPLEPFRVGRYEFRCSESAKALGFNELAELLEKAEREAETKSGPRLLKRPQCYQPPRFGNTLRP